MSVAGITALAAAICLALLRHAALRADLLRADPDRILASPRLADAALSAGGPVWRARCAGCHGEGGGGGAGGVPDLRDGDWLYGEGRVSEIENIVRYGIRSGDSRGWNLASMPAYASARPYAAEPIPPLTPRGAEDVVQLLLADEGRPADRVAATRGQSVYRQAGCWDCHGVDGHGDGAVGAPNLRDAITLYGGSHAALLRSIEGGRRGVSPAFAKLLTPIEIRAVAVYAAALSREAGR